MRKYKESFYNIPIKTDNQGRILIYNTNSLSLSWFDEETYNTFKNQNNISEKSLNPNIILLGFCVDDDIDEISLFQFERYKYIYNEQPEMVQYIIAPTMKCNVHCKYCFENILEDKGDMSEETANQVAAFIITQCNKNMNLKTLNIRWFGGEPTLGITPMKIISSLLIKYANSRNIKYISNIFTNGLLLDKKLTLDLEKTCRINNAQITLDGFSKTYNNLRGLEYDGFERVINNIVEICDIINVTIRINVTKENCKEILPLVLYLLEEKRLKDKIYIYFANVRNYNYNDNTTEFSDEQYEDFKLEIYRELISREYHNCLKVETLNYRLLVSCTPMQSASTSINCDGNLYRCECLMSRDPYIIGNCQFGFYRNKVDLDFLDFKFPLECSNCKYLPVCSCGCREEHIVENRNVDCNAVINRTKNNIEILLMKKEILAKGGK